MGITAGVMAALTAGAGIIEGNKARAEQTRQSKRMANQQAKVAEQQQQRFETEQKRFETEQANRIGRAKAETQRKQRAARQGKGRSTGRRGTILTSNTGIATPAPTGRRTLLGA